MIINFNLLLVWLPMCKYSLTRLACLANQSLRCQKEKLASLDGTARDPPDHLHHSNPALINQQSGAERIAHLSPLLRVLRKLGQSIKRAGGQMSRWYLEAKAESTNSFLIAVDHCRSLHTICATTITIASAIHTVAHLMNVINFSKNYDPNLGNLNMAESKGQNPLELLISVPGVTGLLMILILILMSLSSIDFIRNSSYDLFQLFHRLSVVFVLLLFLHPSSHVLKEQYNVDRHHPELCYNITVRLSTTSNATTDHNQLPLDLATQVGRPNDTNLVRPLSLHYTANQSERSQTTATNLLQLDLSNGSNQTNRHNNSANYHTSSGHLEALKPDRHSRAEADKFCLDDQPLFVAQASVCWYVLSVGLTCYLLDLLLRKLRRSKSSIQLLDAQLDREGNLIELILSNNHKRFARWQPGQFVYLNSPQIAAYEWHPFTISSMDNRTRQFTLHIKTGGDWTGKLRLRLEQLQQNSTGLPAGHFSMLSAPSLQAASSLAKLRPVAWSDTLSQPIQQQQQQQQLVQPFSHEQIEVSLHRTNRARYTICNNSENRSFSYGGLTLYIDGPFHSPFERLLEQQVSVCIANGVGWTAFSSVLQSITSKIVPRRQSSVEVDTNQDWWSQWRNYVPSRAAKSGSQCSQVEPRGQLESITAQLHLMIIVTSIEQLKPFYQLVVNYFTKLREECHMRPDDARNPVKKITAFMTRATSEKALLDDFCRSENVQLSGDIIQVNEAFAIMFGKPNFELYLSKFCLLYANERKISVYCCGSYHVKKTIEEICTNLNGSAELISGQVTRPVYSYHEENF